MFAGYEFPMSDRAPYPSELKDRFIIRLPDGMRDRIRSAAEAANRSMNAEILATLLEAYPDPDPPIPDMAEILAMLEAASSPDDFAARAREANRLLEASGSPYRVDMVPPFPGQIAFSRSPRVPVPPEGETVILDGRTVKRKS